MSVFPGSFLFSEEEGGMMYRVVGSQIPVPGCCEGGFAVQRLREHSRQGGVWEMEPVGGVEQRKFAGGLWVVDGRVKDSYRYSSGRVRVEVDEMIAEIRREAEGRLHDGEAERMDDEMSDQTPKGGERLSPGGNATFHCWVLEGQCGECGDSKWKCGNEEGGGCGEERCFECEGEGDECVGKEGETRAVVEDHPV